MIRNRLAELLAERHLKITRVANDIKGLSRNTITATAQNKGKMIQLETINKLCQYLEIDIKDFFEYLPFDMKVNLNKPAFYSDFWQNDPYEIGNNNPALYHIPDFDMDLYIKKTALSKDIGTKEHTFNLTVRISKIKIDYTVFCYEACVLLGSNSDKFSFEEQKDDFEKFIHSLGSGFKSVLLNNIEAKIKNVISNVVDKNILSTGTPDNTLLKNANIKFTFDNAYKKDSSNTFKVLSNHLA